ncbi:hypothetical protein E2C01_041202 [Portunus trituberculatus]|uniref:Uncharacterized protein n=1 Tax=Portunus trituberculatus TaxID=210409 RepID=A0A5B7FPR9_PORTR|nr:hypothetical protein [Portunus trituberculatus]
MSQQLTYVQRCAVKANQTPGSSPGHTARGAAGMAGVLEWEYWEGRPGVCVRRSVPGKPQEKEVCIYHYLPDDGNSPQLTIYVVHYLNIATFKDFPNVGIHSTAAERGARWAALLFPLCVRVGVSLKGLPEVWGGEYPLRPNIAWRKAHVGRAAPQRYKAQTLIMIHDVHSGDKTSYLRAQWSLASR